MSLRAAFKGGPLPHVLLIAAPLITGCYTHTPRLDHFAWEIDRGLPEVRLEREGSFKLGRLSFALARGLAGLALDEEEDAEALSLLRGLRQIEVSTYRTLGQPAAGLPEALGRSLLKGGWTTLVKARNEGEQLWILARQERRQLRRLLVLSLEEDELNLVLLGGRVDRVLAAAMEFAWQAAEASSDRTDELQDG